MSFTRRMFSALIMPGIRRLTSALTTVSDRRCQASVRLALAAGGVDCLNHWFGCLTSDYMRWQGTADRRFA